MCYASLLEIQVLRKISPIHFASPPCSTESGGTGGWLVSSNPHRWCSCTACPRSSPVTPPCPFPPFPPPYFPPPHQRAQTQYPPPHPCSARCDLDLMSHLKKKLEFWSQPDVPFYFLVTRGIGKFEEPDPTCPTEPSDSQLAEQKYKFSICFVLPLLPWVVFEVRSTLSILPNRTPWLTIGRAKVFVVPH